MNINTRGAYAAQLDSAERSSGHAIPRTEGMVGPAFEQFTRQQLILFGRRCQTLADRVGCKQLNFLDAVDLAYDAATWSGLVDAVGNDVVQATMANAFMKINQP